MAIVPTGHFSSQLTCAVAHFAYTCAVRQAHSYTPPSGADYMPQRTRLPPTRNTATEYRSVLHASELSEEELLCIANARVPSEYDYLDAELEC